MRLAVLAAALASALPAAAITIRVPADVPTIQGGLNAANPGDTVLVDVGVYSEKVVFPRSGSAAAPITLMGDTIGPRPVLDGVGAAGCDMVTIDDRSYVRVVGFEIRNNLGVSDCSGIRVLGNGDGVELRSNIIHDIRGTDAMAITVYGTDPLPIAGLVIANNVVYDCEPATSEAITLNGNVTGFAVTDNLVRDVNNIGIDFIGGEGSIQPDPNLVARNGVCRGNAVLRARSSYGGGFAAGIYVDGGRDIVIERNVVTGSNMGIEIGAENAGIVTSGIVVRENLIWGNEKVGIVFGGYDVGVGRVRNCQFLHNTVVQNDTTGQGLGELWIQWADTNVVRGNVFAATAQDVLLYSEQGNVANALDWNLWHCPGGASAAQFTWQGTGYTGFTAYQIGSGQDAQSLFAEPLLVAPASGDLHLLPLSPARDRGDPAYTPAPGETDVDGQARIIGGRVDIGADEIGGEAIVVGQGLGQPNPNEVKVYTGDGTPAGVTFFAYAAGAWGVNVARGKIDTYPYERILTGPGPGDVFGPQVRAFQRSGPTLPKVNFFAYGTLRYGVNVAAARLDADTFAEILAGPGPGTVFGPHVRGFDYDGAAVAAMAKVSFFAYGTLKYGVNVASGSVDGDAFAEILTGPGPGAIFGPTVRGFDYDGSAVTALGKINFNAFATGGFGVNLAGADVDDDGFAEILTTPGPGSAATYTSRFLGFDYDGSAVTATPGLDVTPFTTLYGGRVGSGDVTGTSRDALLCGAGRDPAADSRVAPNAYAGGATTALPGTFVPFGAARYGVNLSGAALGY